MEWKNIPVSVDVVERAFCIVRSCSKNKEKCPKYICFSFGTSR